MFTRACRSVAGFALVVAMLTLTAASMLARGGADYFSSNMVSASQRAPLLIAPLLSAVIAAAWAAVQAWRAPERVLPALEWWVRLMGPAVLAPVFLALPFERFTGDIEVAILLAILTVALERLMRASLTAWSERPQGEPVRGLQFLSRPSTPLVVLLVLTTGQMVLVGLWSIWSHQRFGTYGFDLGQYDSVFAATLHGRPLAMPPLRLTQNWGDLLDNHADLGTFIFLPFYALYPDAKTLLLIQTVTVAGASVPLYLFAKKRLGSPWQAFAVAVAWLGYAPMHSAQFYDFHWQLVAAALVVCIFAALEHGRMKLYWVFFTMAILCREDVSIGLTALGLYLLFSGERPKLGVVTMIVSVVYFVGLRFVIMRNTSFTGYYKDIMAPDAGGFGSILATMISNPAFLARSLITWEKARYVAQIFAPLAFLPQRRPWLWLLMLPGFFLTVLAAGYLPPIQISFQYVGNWAGYMFPAAVIALASYAATGDGLIRRRAALTAMLVATLVAGLRWGVYSPSRTISGGFERVPFAAPSQADVEREEALREFLKDIPADVAICTSERLQPHTTALHVENYSLRGSSDGCEYLLWSTLPGDQGTDNGQRAVAVGNYEIVQRKAGVVLAKRKPH